MRAALVIALALFATPAMAGDWFKHEFGELRAYHGSWLTVCKDNGAGDCRAVQLAGTDGVDGARRMAINVVAPGKYVIEVFQRNWTLAEDHFPTVTVDGDTTGLPDTSWKRGEIEYANVMETFTITDPAVNDSLIDDLKAGGQAQIAMGNENDRRTANFDLNGITAALSAIERHIATRGN